MWLSPNNFSHFTPTPYLSFFIWSVQRVKKYKYYHDQGPPVEEAYLTHPNFYPNVFFLASSFPATLALHVQCHQFIVLSQCLLLEPLWALTLKSLLNNNLIPHQCSQDRQVKTAGYVPFEENSSHGHPGLSVTPGTSFKFSMSPWTLHSIYRKYLWFLNN